MSPLKRAYATGFAAEFTGIRKLIKSFTSFDGVEEKTRKPTTLYLSLIHISEPTRPY